LQTPAGLWIIDLLGQKGIAINDVPVRSSRLVDGDIVRIGRYQIRIRYRPRAQRSEPELFDFGRAAFVPKQAHRSHAPIDLKLSNWTPATAPFHSGSLDGQDSTPLPIQAISIQSKVDLVSSNPMLPINLAQSESNESILAPLVNQFGLMQQQMFDQFQQAMAMMFQMFGTMHRDQMEVIRAELEQLRELTEEFHALKSELAERTQNQGGPRSPESELNLTEFDRPAGMDSNGLIPGLTGTPAKSKGSSEAGRTNKAPASLSMSLSSKIIGQQSSPEINPLVTQSSANSQPVPSNSRPVIQTNSQSSAKSSSAPESDSDRATVLWLHQRIMVLQRERESRWQKILKLVPGMSST
jgi:hypothetical protein